MAKMTLKRLMREEWWWRNPPLIQPLNGPPIPAWQYDERTSRLHCEESNIQGRAFWKGKMESAAFKYELVRRLDRKAAMPRFVDLDMFQQSHLKETVGEEFSYTVCTARDEKCDLQQNGDGTFSVKRLGYQFAPREGFSHPVMFNLAASNRLLEERFWQFIEGERARLEIKAPGRGGKGGHRDRISWQWLEILDKAHFRLFDQARTSTETGLKAKALKRAREYKSAVLEALGNAAKQKSSL